MTDDELCDLLRISRVTLRKILANGPARKRYRNGGDLRLIQHIHVGGLRRWLKDSVESYIKGEI
jgi:hypothetical protein